MKNLITLVLAIGVTTGAAQAASVKYDYDKSVDFASYKSWAWRQPQAAGGGSIPDARIREALEAGFVADGYSQAERPSADFLIDYHAAARQDVRFDETFRGPGFGRDLRMNRVPVGVLVVDVIDARSGKLAWRGLVEDALASDPQKADKKTEKAVAKLLKKFPPEDN
jgi:hypothetical protein